MTVEIANESGVEIDEYALVELSRFMLDRLGIHPQAELSLLLVDVPAMTELHVKWLNLPGPTDVMSFPMDELDTARGPDSAGPGPALLGDVVLCPEVVKDQASQAGHSLDDELHLLTTHGILHLLGYDHAEPDEEREMFRLQLDLLDQWRDELTARDSRRRLAEVDDAVIGSLSLPAGTPGEAAATGGTAAEDAVADGTEPAVNG